MVEEIVFDVVVRDRDLGADVAIDQVALAGAGADELEIIIEDEALLGKRRLELRAINVVVGLDGVDLALDFGIRHGELLKDDLFVDQKRDDLGVGGAAPGGDRGAGEERIELLPQLMRLAELADVRETGSERS